MKIDVKENKKFSKDESDSVPICKCCSDKRLNDFQENFDIKNVKVGDFVKQRFTGINREDGHEYTENMYVYITEIDEEIKGRLESFPKFISDVNQGDTVYITPSDLSEHMKGPYHE